jgi:RNA polymerase sigma-70 factor, ECF subfamily
MTTSERDDSSPFVRSFDEFYQCAYRSMLALAISVCGRMSVAEDVVQDAFVSAYRSWDRVSVMERPEAWVRKAIVNGATSRFRRLRSEGRAVLRLASRSDLVESGDFVVPDDSFWAHVRRLPARQAQCIALRHFEDLDVPEIAETLGIAEATVRVHLHRGLHTLEKTMGGQR